MHALFVHGMGRSPISGWPLLRRLRRAGLRTSAFGYSAAFEDFSAIRNRLATSISLIASQGDYVVVGHSLGGVLLRAALNSLPPGTKVPAHVFLLGSPCQPARLAQRLTNNFLYRALTGDCGQLLGSASRMAEVGATTVPTTSIAGIRSLALTRRLFGGEPNDGVVSLSEVSAAWSGSPVCVPALHTLLPTNRGVTQIILQRLA